MTKSKKKPIWSEGKRWGTNEYNKRLSKENKISYKIDKRRVKLDEEERKKIKEVWMQEK